MKKLIFLFLGFFCFAHSQSDSLKLEQLADKFEKRLEASQLKAKTLEKIDKENETLVYKTKIYILKLLHKNKKAESQAVRNQLKNTQAVKVKNINEPIIEINVPDGYDSIRGTFFYRLFHKDKIYIRAYKFEGNEKIYLD